MKMNHDIGRLGAFTLIELILAIAIAAIVMIAINAVFFSAMKVQDSTDRLVASALPIQQALAIMRRDFEGTMPPYSNGVFSGNFEAGSTATGSSGQPVSITLYTTTGAMDSLSPWGEVQMVTYELKSANGSGAGRDLYRSVTRNVLATTMPQPEDQWMIGGVQSIEFSCYDGTQWRDEWDTSMTDTNLPTAVRVRLLMASADGNQGQPRPVEMVVPVDSQPRLLQPPTSN